MSLKMSFANRRHVSLKRKCCHFDEILITDCTESCHFDNFRCSQWWKFRQNDNISVSVLVRPKHSPLLLWCRLLGNEHWSLRFASPDHNISRKLTSTNCYIENVDHFIPPMCSIDLWSPHKGIITPRWNKPQSMSSYLVVNYSLNNWQGLGAKSCPRNW